MYLSRLMLNPRSREARRDLSDHYQMHRTVLNGFSELPPSVDFRRQHGILYRIDIISNACVPCVLVQSITKPDWNFLSKVPDYLLPTDSSETPNPDFKNISVLYDNLNNGQTLAFRLRANVTRKVETKSGPDGRRNHGRRAPLRTIEEQKEWLSRKAGQGGFELLNVEICDDIPDIRIIPERDVTCIKPSIGDTRTLTFASVLFEGRLQIISADVFRKTLKEGIGPAKAFGFGLVSIAAH